jgi:hypothetical protein
MENYREAWNSKLIQDVRSELAAGRFHTYCLRSPACPIVRKSEQAAELPSGQAAYMQARRLWTRLNRVSRGRAATLLQTARLAGIRTRRALTDPTYIVRHTTRIIRRDRT